MLQQFLTKKSSSHVYGTMQQYFSKFDLQSTSFLSPKQQEAARHLNIGPPVKKNCCKICMAKKKVYMLCDPAALAFLPSNNFNSTHSNREFCPFLLGTIDFVFILENTALRNQTKILLQQHIFKRNMLGKEKYLIY